MAKDIIYQFSLRWRPSTTVNIAVSCAGAIRQSGYELWECLHLGWFMSLHSTIEARRLRRRHRG